jgi:hypothetical protein
LDFKGIKGGRYGGSGIGCQDLGTIDEENTLSLADDRSNTGR